MSVAAGSHYKPIPFEDGWSLVKREGVERALERLSKTFSKKPLKNDEVSKLYTVVYQMCTQDTPNNWSGKLYYTVLDELRSICENIIEPRLKRAGDQELLQVFLDEWNKFLILIKCFRSILGYLDRYYVKRLALLSLEGMGIKAFHECVFEQNKTRLTRAFLLHVARDRREPTPSFHGLLKKVMEIYVIVGQSTMDVYEKELEIPLIDATEKYMAEEAARWAKASRCERYLAKVKAQLEAENTRVDNYLHPDSRAKLIKECEKQLIGVHLETVLNLPDSGCRWMLQNENYDDLREMFLLFRRIPNGLAPMGIVFRKYLQEIGANLLSNPRYENQWNNKLDNCLVADIVAMHQKYRGLLKNIFQEHNTFHRALKEAFEYFINLPLPAPSSAAELTCDEHQGGSSKRRRRRVFRPREEIHISELLSDFLDRKLRKGPSEMAPKSPTLNDSEWASFLTPRTEAELERSLAITVDIFGFVNDKDVFGEFYRKHLAKRLILGRSTSQDAENVVIRRLQQVCGNPFVSKFHGMMRDLMAAKALQASYQEFLMTEGLQEDLGATEFNIMVLTSGFWPTYKEERMQKIPTQLQTMANSFQQFYAKQTAYRLLTFVHTLGSITLSTVLESSGNKLDLIVSMFQGCALLLFNEADELSLSEMGTKLGTTDAVLQKHLYALVKGKQKILLQNPENGKYRVNRDFDTKLRRLRIPLLPSEKSSKTKQEREQTILKISEERRYAVEAAIIRIMKKMKTVSYDELVKEIEGVLSHVFKPHPQTIKTRVDDLVRRDYIKRDGKNENMLRYVP